MATRVLAFFGSILAVVGLSVPRAAEAAAGWRASWSGKAIVLEYGGQEVLAVRSVRVAAPGGALDVLKAPFKASKPDVEGGVYRQVFSRPAAGAAQSVTVEAEWEGSALSFSAELERGLRARVAVDADAAWGKDPWLCRIGPAENPDIVQTALGEMQENPRCDAVFDRLDNRVLLVRADRCVWKKEGERLHLQVAATAGEVFAARVLADYYAKLGSGQFRVRHYEPIDDAVKKHFPRPVSGWCSWYCFGMPIDEKKILDNARVVAEKLKPFGAEYVQVDDGWFGGGEGWQRGPRDWHKTHAAFPNGMQRVADEIHALGLKAGIWLVPQVHDNEAVARQNHGAFIWNKDDKSPFAGKKLGSFVVDPTSEAGRAYLRSLMKTMADEWHYDYFKIDFQTSFPRIYEKNRRLLHNPEIAGEEAYRLSLRAIREGIGDNRFLLGSLNIPKGALSAVGYMNGARSEGDVSTAWDGQGGSYWNFQHALGGTLAWYFLHNVVWYCDPDVLLVRPPLTLDQARAWATLLAVTGQHLMASDDLTRLPEERMRILQQVFPAQNIRPVDLYPYPFKWGKPVRVFGAPRIWNLKIGRGGDSRDVVAVFNWEKGAAAVNVSLADLGLGGDGAGEYEVFELWGWRHVGRVREGFEARLEPTSAQVFVLRKALPRPQVMTTSRHVVAGYVDGVRTRWDRRTRTLLGECTVVGGFPYKAAIVVPEAGGKLKAVSAHAGGRAVGFTQEGALVTLEWTPEKSGTAEWRVGF